MPSAQQIIDHYRLEPLDKEGGYFRQVWRSGLRVENNTLCERYPDEGTHPMGTLIHFLITEGSFSAMHRLPTPEHWFYHLGDAAEMLLLYGDGRGEKVTLGPDLISGERLQMTTPMDCWQGTVLVERKGGVGYFFGSCVMVPGFEWPDFELGDRETLFAEYPDFKEDIDSRTREDPVEGQL